MAASPSVLAAVDAGSVSAPDASDCRQVKRSLSIAGHRTSIALEPPYWRALTAAAARRGLSATAFITAIDATRGRAPLASALRVFLLREEAHTAAPARGAGGLPE